MPTGINLVSPSYTPLWGLIVIPIVLLFIVLWIAIKSPSWCHWVEKRRRERSASDTSRGSSSNDSETPFSAQGQV